MTKPEPSFRAAALLVIALLSLYGLVRGCGKDDAPGNGSAIPAPPEDSVPQAPATREDSLDVFIDGLLDFLKNDIEQ